MAKVTAILVHDENLIGKGIQVVTNNYWNHIALQTDQEIIEALLETGVTFSPLDKYNTGYDVKRIVIDIPDIDALEAEAKRLQGKPYSEISCLDGGIYDLSGEEIPNDGDSAYDCSKLFTHLVRIGGFKILGDLQESYVTPGDDDKALEA
jgi:hypothetical protein